MQTQSNSLYWREVLMPLDTLHHSGAHLHQIRNVTVATTAWSNLSLWLRVCCDFLANGTSGKKETFVKSKRPRNQLIGRKVSQLPTRKIKLLTCGENSIWFAIRFATAIRDCIFLLKRCLWEAAKLVCPEFSGMNEEKKHGTKKQSKKKNSTRSFIEMFPCFPPFLIGERKAQWEFLPMPSHGCHCFSTL